MISEVISTFKVLNYTIYEKKSVNRVVQVFKNGVLI
jgi:hypothetical protein